MRLQKEGGSAGGEEEGELRGAGREHEIMIIVTFNIIFDT